MIRRQALSATQGKKGTFEENRRRYKGMKNKANKAVSKAMREKAEEVHTELLNNKNAEMGCLGQ